MHRGTVSISPEALTRREVDIVELTLGLTEVMSPTKPMSTSCGGYMEFIRGKQAQVINLLHKRLQ